MFLAHKRLLPRSEPVGERILFAPIARQRVGITAPDHGLQNAPNASMILFSRRAYLHFGNLTSFLEPSYLRCTFDAGPGWLNCPPGHQEEWAEMKIQMMPATTLIAKNFPV